MFGRRQGRRGCGGGVSRLLTACATGECAKVVGNTGTRAMELGFYPGAAVRVISNDPEATSMVVLVGESRLVLPRDMAVTVVVRGCGGRGGGWLRRWGWRPTGDDDAQADS